MADKLLHDPADKCEENSIALMTQYFVPSSRIEATSDRAHKLFEIVRSIRRIARDRPHA